MRYIATICLLLVLSIAGSSAAGQALIVTTNQDVVDPTDLKLSLREAIAKTNAAQDPISIIIFSSEANKVNIEEELGAIAITGPVAIIGPVRIDGRQKTRLFDIIGTAASFTDVEFSNGSATGEGTDGGAVFTSASNIIFDNCTFRNNIAEGNGGAVACDKANNIVFKGCTFSKNSAKNGGGMIADAQTMVLLRCTFTKNIATNGGAVNIVNGQVLDCNSCIFSQNNASNDGGAIFNNGAINSIRNCQFAKNTADNGGGAIFNGEVGQIEAISNSSFNSNSAIDGGAVFVSEVPQKRRGFINAMIFCEFAKNKASNDGGAYFDSGFSATVFDCTFEKNSAGNNGGALSVILGEITGCTFSKNKAGNDGGAVAVIDGEGIIIDTTLDGNSAGNNGGAVAIFSGFTAIDRCTLVKNKAKNNGGGTFGDQLPNIFVSNTTYSTNNARGNGGGHFDNNANVEGGSFFDFCTFSKNKASGDGGGIAAVAAPVSVGNSIFENGKGKNGADLSGSFADNGFNLVEDPDGHNIVDAINGNIVGQGDANLAKLADNGGPTETHALQEGSLAIDAAGGSFGEDQRGFIRPDPKIENLDIGAFELGSPENFAISLTARAYSDKDGTTISWQTPSLDGIAEFRVWRRQIGRSNFQNLGSVFAPSSDNDYFFKDTIALDSQKRYAYKIECVTIDGRSNFSHSIVAYRRAVAEQIAGAKE